MKWEPLKKRLEQILNADVRFETIASQQWVNGADSLELAGRIHFYLRKQNKTIETLSVESVLTRSERQLIELMVRTFREQDEWSVNGRQAEADGLQNIKLLRSWIFRQLEKGKMDEEVPDALSSLGALYHTRVPILVLGESGNGKHTLELKRLLESFFDTEILLVPLLDGEWMILAPESVISASRADGRTGEEESLEESLESIGMGLHEMLTEEWIGECHLSIDYPFVPAKDLVPALLRMRETIALGRRFRVQLHVHLPWQLRLEKLLSLLPEAETRKFVEQILKRMDYAMDPETLQTLEQFFELDCNVSETAKKLYIHRNTLLYRLDKFKQETGLDVRTFSDAVLVKIALVLYKVTK